MPTLVLQKRYFIVSLYFRRNSVLKYYIHLSHILVNWTIEWDSGVVFSKLLSAILAFHGLKWCYHNVGFKTSFLLLKHQCLSYFWIKNFTKKLFPHIIKLFYRVFHFSSLDFVYHILLFYLIFYFAIY